MRCGAVLSRRRRVCSGWVGGWMSLRMSLSEWVVECLCVNPNDIPPTHPPTHPNLDAPVRIHPLEYAGEDVSSKLTKLRAKLKEKEATALLISALDEVVRRPSPTHPPTHPPFPQSPIHLPPAHLPT